MAEKARTENEKVEKDRLDKEKADTDLEKTVADKARLEEERLEQSKVEKARLAKKKEDLEKHVSAEKEKAKNKLAGKQEKKERQKLKKQEEKKRKKESSESDGSTDSPKKDRNMSPGELRRLKLAEGFVPMANAVEGSEPASSTSGLEIKLDLLSHSAPSVSYSALAAGEPSLDRNKISKENRTGV